jgi:SH3 domain-containing protein
MRWVLLVLTLCQFAIAGNASGAERQYREVTIADPFIELHTGPGRGYPIFFVAERGEEIELLMRRTEWFKVRVARGEEGWVHFEQLTTTLNPDGEPFDLPALGFSDYAARKWEVGALYGDFGGANVIGMYGSRTVTPNLSGEIWVSQALGRFSDNTLVTLDIVHLMYPDWRASPYFTLGGGVIKTEPKATLVATTDRTDNVALAGAGVRVYLTRRFVFRGEYKTHVVFTSRDDNEEVQEWKAGFSFFF